MIIKMIRFLLIIVLFSLAFYLIGYRQGKSDTYDDFILDKCWIGPETQDVICIEYMGKD